MHIVNARHGYLKPRDAYRVNTVLENGGVAILPSDSGYTLVCSLGEKKAVERVCLISTREKLPLFTSLCRNFSHIAHYAKVDNHQYRCIKTLFLCAFTCILHTSRKVSQWLQPKKCKNIALCVPKHNIMPKIRATLGTLIGISRFGTDMDLSNLGDLPEQISRQVNIAIDEWHGMPTTILDLTTMPSTLIWQGAGDATPFL